NKVDDAETRGAAALARERDPPRLRCADPADLGKRESVWPIRSRHEYAIGIAVIEMAPGDTTVGSTPSSARVRASCSSDRRSRMFRVNVPYGFKCCHFRAIAPGGQPR